MAVIIVIVLLAAFLGGVAAAFVLIVRIAGSQEGPQLLDHAPTRLTRAARRVTGMYVRTAVRASAMKEADVD
jgi:hypothetical protein